MVRSTENNSEHELLLLQNRVSRRSRHEKHLSIWFYLDAHVAGENPMTFAPLLFFVCLVAAIILEVIVHGAH